MFTLTQMKYTGLGKYRTLLFSKSTNLLDEVEHKKFNRVSAYIDEKYPESYNPLRSGPDYICFACHLGDTGLIEKHDQNKYYNLSLKIQNYVYNGKTKLRVVLNESTLTESPVKTIDYMDVEIPEFE
uniref:Uncharacterized protein n=1 Tax=viral metagenome TaxID=1070528 RepID=A0A6C0JU28_9ZZZZ